MKVSTCQALDAPVLEEWAESGFETSVSVSEAELAVCVASPHKDAIVVSESDRVSITTRYLGDGDVVLFEELYLLEFDASLLARFAVTKGAFLSVSRSPHVAVLS